MEYGYGVGEKSERKNSTMKRILVVSWFYPPINSSEGLVTYKLLKNSKFEYDICMQDSNDSWSYGKNEKLPECGNVRKICAKSTTLLEWKKEVVSYFEKHMNEYDIVMTRSMPPESHEIGLEIKKIKPKIKWIASFGDPIANNPFVLKEMTKASPYSVKACGASSLDMRWILSPKRFLKNMLWKKREKKKSVPLEKERVLEALIMSICDYVIFNNEYQKKYMLSKTETNIDKKAVVLPHSFDLTLYDAVIPERENSKIRMVYIGHLDNIRTPHLFFEALNELKKQDETLADKLEVQFYGNMSDKEKVYLMDSELLDVVQVKKPVDYKTSLAIMRDSDWLIHIDANLHGILNENIFFAAKLADYIGAKKPIFGITMFDGAGADILRTVNGITVSYTVDEIKNYLYLIIYRNYEVVINQESVDRFNAVEVAKEFDELVSSI